MSSSSPPQAPHTGVVLGGRYRLVQRLGQDALADHFLAEDTQLGESLLVLVLRGGPAPLPARRRAFEEHALRLTGVHRGGEVNLLEVGEDEHHGAFAALSLPAGTSPAEVLRDARPARTEAPAPPPEAAHRSPLSPDSVQREAEPAAPDVLELVGPLELEELAPPTAAPGDSGPAPLYARPGRPRQITPVGIERPTPRRPPEEAPLHHRPSRNWRLPKRLLIAVVTTTVLALAAWWIVTAWRAHQTSSGDADEATPVGIEPIPGAPRGEVSLRFVVEPESATMYYRGRRVPGLFVRAPRSSRPVQVEFRAPGYHRRTVTVVPDRNRKVLVVLKRR